MGELEKETKRSEIERHYNGMINDSMSKMEKDLLIAEKNHKLKLLGINPEFNAEKERAKNQFNCVGCGS